MKLKIMTFGLLLSFALVAEPAKDRRKPSRQPSESAFTGCVDETQDGNYILTDEKSLSPIAGLEAVGFEKEGFAKHLGHRVSVKGQAVSQGNRAIIKVRSIQTLAETCAPHEEAK
jgi:hypothetical protein